MTQARETRTLLLDESGIRRALTRIAHEIVEQADEAPLAFIGIRTRGVHLAARLAKLATEITAAKAPVPIGELDITLYRDDLDTLSDRRVLNATQVDFDVSGYRIVLVDDVLFTGRTVRAALGAITDLGRPRRIELAVLVDRGHRELPIRPDYVGRNQPTRKDETVKLSLKEEEGIDQLDLVSREVRE